MDYTIELWSILTDHYAQCDCGEWLEVSTDQADLENKVREHRTQHHNNGDNVEVI